MWRNARTRHHQENENDIFKEKDVEDVQCPSVDVQKMEFRTIPTVLPKYVLHDWSLHFTLVGQS